MIPKMNIISKLYQEQVVNKIKETNWEEGTTGPWVVELDTTEICDLACPGCISADIMETKNSFSNQRLIELGEELCEIGVKAVILIGGGEPLAHPKIGEFITYLGEHDINIGITTNGSFIGKHLDVIAKYSFWTRVSVDAATNETFLKLRPTKGGTSKFDKIIQNMRDLAEVKKGKLGFSFLIRTEADGFGIESNIHEIYNAAVLAKDIGCDYFEVKPSYNFVGGVDHSLVKHDPKRMEEAREQIERLDELATDNFKIMRAITLEDSLNGVEREQTKDYHYCPMTELRTLICPSGVFVCPYWRGKERFRIGDVNNTSMKDMWLGKRRKQVMAYLDPVKHCRFHCLRHESNIEVIKMIDLFNQGKDVETTEEYDRFI